MTKFQKAMEVCKGMSRAYIDGFIDATFGNPFNAGKEACGMFCSYDRYSADYVSYSTGYDAGTVWVSSQPVIG